MPVIKSHKAIRALLITLITVLAAIGSFYAGSYLSAYRVQNKLSKVNVQDYSAQINAAAQKDFILKIGSKELTLTGEEIKKWTQSYTRNYTGKTQLRLSEEKVKSYLEALVTNFESEAENARLAFENGQLIEEAHAVSGTKLDVFKASSALWKGIVGDKTVIDLPIETINPEITFEKVAALGIDSLLSAGQSDFVGSSGARVQNIRVSSGLFDQILIPKGQEFSFNLILGEVEASTGYAAEKVIKSNKLVYEYGGGVCQVSTTMFRSAILAGLPITQRKPHSFPVRYYNPQGFDATVYPGVQDLKFINNTDAPILIQRKIDGTKITFEMYGKSDGRKVSMQGPYQYEINPDGSMKAYFTRTIAYDNQQDRKENFYSNYKSPALYPLEINPLE